MTLERLSTEASAGRLGGLLFHEVKLAKGEEFLNSAGCSLRSESTYAWPRLGRLYITTYRLVWSPLRLPAWPGGKRSLLTIQLADIEKCSVVPWELSPLASSSLVVLAHGDTYNFGTWFGTSALKIAGEIHAAMRQNQQGT